MSAFINGWTKESVIKHIKENFKGKAVDQEEGYCKYLTEDGEWRNVCNTNGNNRKDAKVLYWQPHPEMPKDVL